MSVVRITLATVAMLSGSILAGCGSDGMMATTSAGGAGTSSSTTSASGGSGGLGGGGGGGFVTAPHQDQPQLVNPDNGPVLTAPRVQLIVYESDPFVADVDAFVAELQSTGTWSAQTAEYGVGPFTILPTIKLPGPVPTTLDDETGDPSPFEKNLAAQITGANPAWGAADPSTMYLFLMPLGTDVKSFGHCCVDYLGYHYEAPAGLSSVPYGIVCHCKEEPGDSLTALEYVTTTVIHEMAEIATDPYVVNSPAFSQPDDDHVIWTIATGGECSDMCDYNADTNFTPAGAKYKVQRSWSNAAAKAGKNPCVPNSITAPYFNSTPVLADTVTIVNYFNPVKTKGVKIPVGETRTIDVQLWSEAPTSGPWTVQAYDLEDYLGSTPHLEVSLDKNTGSNGDTLKLTIKVLSGGNDYGGQGFVLVSDLGGQQNISMGAVGQ